MKGYLKFSAIVGAAGIFACSQAVVFMDQIGSDPTQFNGSANSQRYEASNSGFDIAALDDFVVAGASTITQIEAVVGQGGTNFNSAQYANIQNWSVEVYSSVAAAGSNLNGNIAHVVVAPGSVTVNQSYTSAISFGALATIPVSISLPTAGTYYIAVVPRLDATANLYQIGIGETTMAAPSPGGNNAFQANPNQGFQQGTTFAIQGNVNLAYRLTGTPVPEPGTIAALSLGAAAFLRRRKKA